jgi:hypothetical protein
MNEVIALEVYLNVNGNCFEKSNNNGMFILNNDNFEGFIDEVFVFGKLTDSSLTMYALFELFKPVRYEACLCNGSYEGIIMHHDDWDTDHSFPCGHVRINIARSKQSGTKLINELEKRINGFRDNLNRDNKRFYDTLKPKEESPKLLALVSA